MADEQEKTESPDAGKKKKLFIIVGAAAAVVIIAVVAFLMMGGKKSTPKEGEKGGEAKQEEKKGEGGHGAAAPAGGHGGGGAPAAGVAANVFAFDPFIVNIYDGQELRYLRVKIELELASPDVRGELEMRQSAIKDAILTLLSTKTLHDIMDLKGKNQLREEVLASVNKIVPPGKIARVFFTDFVVQ
ncbi:MAG: flagellar basal body-associated FliL family protein [Desulfuromonadia bacterium]